MDGDTEEEETNAAAAFLPFLLFLRDAEDDMDADDDIDVHLWAT